MIGILINTNKKIMTTNDLDETTILFKRIENILSTNEYAKNNLKKVTDISPTGNSERTFIEVIDRKNKEMNSQYLEVAHEIKKLVSETSFFGEKIFATVM